MWYIRQRCFLEFEAGDFAYKNGMPNECVSIEEEGFSSSPLAILQKAHVG